VPARPLIGITLFGPATRRFQMTRRKRWSIYGGIICAIVVAQVIFLSNVISPLPDVQQPPAEANRVVHPAGFSIVKPGRTHAIVETASSVSDDSINILPDVGGSRYSPVLNVRRLRDPPDLSRLERDGFQAGTFQGQQVIVYSGPSGTYDAYRVMTNRGGEWYEVALLIPNGDSAPASIPSPEWQRYLETFTPAATPTTTRPSGGAE
jgi:hypothetical protein